LLCLLLGLLARAQQFAPDAYSYAVIQIHQNGGWGDWHCPSNCIAQVFTQSVRGYASAEVRAEREPGMPSWSVRVGTEGSWIAGPTRITFYTVPDVNRTEQPFAQFMVRYLPVNLDRRPQNVRVQPAGTEARIIGETSSDLEHWQPVAEMRSPAGETNRFWRLRVVLIPPSGQAPGAEAPGPEGSRDYRGR
jgi:hypothetical protein